MTAPALATATGGRPRVIICGGGLAGLAAAKTLVDNGFEIELLEQRPILGGKVSAWKDADGDWIETGLHVFFGAYVEIYELMKELGIYNRILWKEHKLTYTLAGGERFSFRTTKLPSPLHLLPAVFENHYFSLPEKLTLGKSLFPMVFGNEQYMGRAGPLHLPGMASALGHQRAHAQEDVSAHDAVAEVHAARRKFRPKSCWTWPGRSCASRTLPAWVF